MSAREFRELLLKMHCHVDLPSTYFFADENIPHWLNLTKAIKGRQEKHAVKHDLFCNTNEKKNQTDSSETLSGVSASVFDSSMRSRSYFSRCKVLALRF